MQALTDPNPAPKRSAATLYWQHAACSWKSQSRRERLETPPKIKKAEVKQQLETSQAQDCGGIASRRTESHLHKFAGLYLRAVDSSAVPQQLASPGRLCEPLLGLYKDSWANHISQQGFVRIGQG